MEENNNKLNKTWKIEAFQTKNRVPRHKVGNARPQNDAIAKNRDTCQDLERIEDIIAREYVANTDRCFKEIDTYFAKLSNTDECEQSHDIRIALSQAYRYITGEHTQDYMHAWLKTHDGANNRVFYYAMWKSDGIIYDDTYDVLNHTDYAIEFSYTGKKSKVTGYYPETRNSKTRSTARRYDNLQRFRGSKD